jgi:hypothetical protein
VSLFFRPVDDPCDPFLNECDVEVDQQGKVLVSQAEICEKVLFVNWSLD